MMKTVQKTTIGSFTVAPDSVTTETLSSQRDNALNQFSIQHQSDHGLG